MILKRSALDKAFEVTSYFEGGYCAITGNFDGQGLSLGFLQWNFGQGTLQPLFMRLFNEFSNISDAILPKGGKWLKDAIENNYVMQWVKEIQINNRLIDPWKSALYKLCQTAEFIQIQKDAAQTYVDYAVSMCNGFNLTTDRAYSLMFDIAVQCGPMSTYELAEPTYTAKLEAVANTAINRCLPIWQDDVRKRKLAIVYGTNLGRGWSGVEFCEESAFEVEKEVELPEIIKSINLLCECGVISDTSYWVENCYSGETTINGEYMQTLINRFTAMYRTGLHTQEDVVNVLRDFNIIGDLNYWLENAVPGKEVNLEFGHTVINRMATKIKGQ